MDKYKLDKKIKPIVKLLQKNKFETTSSCQGGKDHAFYLPRITIIPKPEQTLKQLRKQLVKFLIENLFYGFEINEIRGYQSSITVWKQYKFIELNFWSNL